MQMGCNVSPISTRLFNQSRPLVPGERSMNCQRQSVFVQVTVNLAEETAQEDRNESNFRLLSLDLILMTQVSSEKIPELYS